MNNKGFAITSIIYLLLLLFLILVLGMLLMLGSQKTILDNYKSTILDEITKTPTTDNYVQEGLVLWYDAKINYDKIQQVLINNDVFADLATNNDGSLINFASGNWHDNFLYFPGTDEYVTTNYAAHNFTANDDFSLEIYLQILAVNADSENEANSSVLFGSYDGEGYGVSWVTYDEDDTKYHLIAGLVNAENNVFTPEFEVTDYTRRKHIVMSYSNMYNELKLYVNGDLVAVEDASSGDYTTSLGDIGIGLSQTFDNEFLADYTNMELYSARIYERAISHNEVLQNYAVDNARYYYE